MQMRLLRVLENRTYSPLGASTNLQMKARVIAATHRNLKEMIGDGQKLWISGAMLKLYCPVIF
jgi:transcriptional regulator with PAS, ATPase and Fis domain